MEAGRRTRSVPAGVAATRALLRDGHATAAGHLAAVLAAIEDVDADLRAYVAVGAEAALREAERADRRIRSLGPDAWRDRPLLGVPVSVKDLVQTRDLPTRRGSLLPNDRPAVDAPLVARLRAAGAIVVGKTATCEYGWCGSTVSRLGPATGNPWDLTRSAGGSSGGSAAAVSAGLCAASIGTDGAGSIRIPAAFCGVVGFKPTFGAVPYVPACADRLAHAGPITTTVADAAELLAVLAGPHPADPDSLLRAAAAPRPAAGASVAWLECPGASDEVRRVVDPVPALLADLGHRVERIDLPYADPGPALVDLIAAEEAAGTTPEQEEWIDQGRLEVVRHGRTLSGADVARAEDVRLALRTTLAAVMDRYDLLAMATLPVAPFGREEIGPAWAADPADLAWTAWTPGTYPFNLTGQPAVSLPAGLDRDGLPVGVQLVGPVGGDELVLAVAARLEAALGTLPPPPLTRTR